MTLIATPDRATAARMLIERLTRQGESIATAYPLVFQERFSGRVVGLTEGDEVRSACGVLARDFVLRDGSTIRGGLIGSVCTDPEWRGRGYGTRLLAEAEAALMAEGCGFALLWADNATFYLERGYSPIGTEADFGIDAAVAARLPVVEGVRLLRPEDAGAIHRLYERHPVRVERTCDETRALLRCPGMETLVLEREGIVVAYACCGKGKDLPNAVHEWGGSADDVIGLLRTHYQRRFEAGPGNLFLMAPTVSRDLASRLESLDARYSLGILGLGKVLDRSVVARMLDERLQPHGSATVIDTPSGSRVRITGPRDDDTLDDDGVIALLLGTSEVHPHVEDFLARFGVGGAALPLEPFAWGLDSI